MQRHLGSGSAQYSEPRYNRPTLTPPRSSQQNKQGGSCWYHRRSGTGASCCTLPCPFFCKRSRQLLTAAYDIGYSHSHLFFVVNRVSNARRIVDMGAEICIAPASTEDRRRSDNISSPKAVEDTAIATGALSSLNIYIGLRHPFLWIFVVVDNILAILVGGVSSYFKLVVSVRDRCLKYNNTSLTVPGLRSDICSCTICAFQRVSAYHHVLAEFKFLMKPENREGPVNSTVTQHIITHPTFSHGAATKAVQQEASSCTRCV